MPLVLPLSKGGHGNNWDHTILYHIPYYLIFTISVSAHELSEKELKNGLSVLPCHLSSSGLEP